MIVYLEYKRKFILVSQIEFNTRIKYNNKFAMELVL